MQSVWFKLGVWAAAILLFVVLLWQNGALREELGKEKESCNTRVAQSVAEVEKVTRTAQEKAADETIAALKNELERNKQMNKELIEKLGIRDAQLNRSRKDLRDALNRTTDACASATVPSDLWLHTYGVRGEADPG